MSVTYRWRETSREVYAVVWARHGDEMVVFASCTDTDGDLTGAPYVMTEWGFKGSDAALIRCERRGKRGEERFAYLIVDGIEADE